MSSSFFFTSVRKFSSKHIALKVDMPRTGKYTVFRCVCVSFSLESLHAGAVKGLIHSYFSKAKTKQKRLFELSVYASLCWSCGTACWFFPQVPRTVHQLTDNCRSHDGILRLAAGVLDLLVTFFPESMDKLEPDQGLFEGPKPVLLESASPDQLISMLRGNQRETSHIEFGAHQVRFGVSLTWNLLTASIKCGSKFVWKEERFTCKVHGRHFINKFVSYRFGFLG